MKEVINSRILWAISILILICLFSFPAQAQYGGGTGEPNEPYQIATAEDMLLLGDSPEDYDKHFILTTDIDLDPNLPGRKVFDKAVIAPDTNDVTTWFEGTGFTGVFDGNGHTISHLTIRGVNSLGLFGKLDSGAKISNLGLEVGDVNGTGVCVGGLVGTNSGSITTSYSTGMVNGNLEVGGLVGTNSGSITTSYSTGMVNGNLEVGGLVGANSGLGSITASHSSSEVSGSEDVGGLVGINGGSITAGSSTGTVTGNEYVGGLVGWSYGGIINTSCNTGTVSGDYYVGGLVGSNYGSIIASYSTATVSSTGTVNGGSNVGGLVGCVN